LAVCFLLIIGAVGIAQAILEVSEGDRPQVADLFTRVPTATNLRSFERDLETSCWFSKTLRPVMQDLRFRLLWDVGDKAVLGRQGWWFYKPDVRYLVEPPEPQDSPGSGYGPVISAIVGFRDRLAQRGIHLLVVPAPGKPGIYPDRLSHRAAPTAYSGRGPTHRLISELRQAGVEVVDLFEPFLRARAGGSHDYEMPYYLARDTHWNGNGVRLAAQVIAARVRQLGWVPPGSVKYDLKPVSVRRRGDVLRMLDNPRIAERFPTEEAFCTQVIRCDSGQPYRDDPNASVLVLGDSFLRIYERDEPGSAGLIAHLAWELGQPLASIVNDGGASTLVRRQLADRPNLLGGKKLVIWEFVERDIRFGAEGWKDVFLPDPVRPSAHGTTQTEPSGASRQP